MCITVGSKTGNVVYLITARDDKVEEAVLFLNQVDEADRLALMDGEQAAETPIVCTCKDKCAAGDVDTSCPVCKNNMSECTGKEPVTAVEPEPDEPEEPAARKNGGPGVNRRGVRIRGGAGGAGGPVDPEGAAGVPPPGSSPPAWGDGAGGGGAWPPTPFCPTSVR